MQTFALESKTKARVTSVSINGENHGKEVKPAVTLSLTMTVSNDWLATLSPSMKSAFYSRAKGSPQQDVPGTEVSDSPTLRMPELGALPWNKEYSGLGLTIDHGIGGESDIVVTDCKADNIVLEFKEGGSVDVSYKLKSNTPDEATRGRLTSLIKRDIVITIAPPEADPQQRIDDDKAPKAPAKAKAAAKDATDTFAEQHAGATH